MLSESGRLSKLRLGDLLLAHTLITPDQLHTGLEFALAKGRRLGEALVELGFLAESDLVRTLAQQLGIPWEPGPDLEVDSAAAGLISEDTAKQLQAIPIRRDGDTLVVATADPMNFLALDHISLKTGFTVRAVAVSNQTLQRALVRVYGIPEIAGDDVLAATVYDITAPSDNQIVRLVNTLFTQAITNRASDVHVEPQEDQLRVRFRIDGTLVEGSPLPLSVHAPLVSRMKVMAGMDIAERRIPQDGQIMITYQGRRIDLRISTVPTFHGERVAIRLLERNQGLRGLDQLGMPPKEEAVYREMISRPNGLILATGPTGSGKTTTLMATLAALNRPHVNILTIEDPIEYHVPGISQMQVNPKAGLTFSTGLRAFLRQDPDIIMIGEIRDFETADIAIRAAMTGHLVFSTLHTNSAAGAVGRMLDMGVEPFLLASSLLGVVSQRLVRVLCPRCRQPYPLDTDSPARLLPGMPAGPVTLYRPNGCGFCSHLGYKGRQGVFEVLPITPAVRELMMDRASTSAIQEEVSRRELARSLWAAAVDKVLAGVTSLEEIHKVAFAEV